MQRIGAYNKYWQYYYVNDYPNQDNPWLDYCLNSTLKIENKIFYICGENK